jgi:hypothetical protein
MGIVGIDPALITPKNWDIVNMNELRQKRSGNPQVLKQDSAGIINPVSLFYPPVTNMAIEFSHLRMILHLDARLQRISHCHVRLPMPGPGFCPSFEARGAEKGTGWAVLVVKCTFFTDEKVIVGETQTFFL